MSHNLTLCLLHTYSSSSSVYLQTSSGAVLGDDADVGGVNTGSDEAGQVVELDVAHLEKQHE